MLCSNQQQFQLPRFDRNPTAVTCRRPLTLHTLLLLLSCCRPPLPTAPAGSLAASSPPTWMALSQETTALTPSASARTQQSSSGEQLQLQCGLDCARAQLQLAESGR
jgi:hypothetical protein